ncbi:MAG: TMEM143 family protein [Pseudomonadota bacterium]
MPVDQRRQFQSFAEILTAYVHFKAQKNLELMKQSYAYFNPNQECLLPGLTQEESEQQANILAETFKRVLVDANYRELNQQDIEKALSQSSLVPVNTQVDLDAYKRILLFYRGSDVKDVTIKRFLFKKQISFDNYDHVAVLLEIKPKQYFDKKEKYKEIANFEAGKVYLYLYKNIPHYDLELLFPNVKISMSLRDKLMLIIPALGAAIPMLIKILPALGLLIGAIALVVFGWNLDGKFDVDVSDPKAVYPLLLASFSACVALGGFAVRQYIKYKSKRLEFLKKVTDVLFFKSLDVCQGVLHSVIDAAEEEQSKEMFLIYFILLQEKQPLSQEQIRDKVNLWTKEHLGIKTNIQIEKSLEHLTSLQEVSNTTNEIACIVKSLDDGCFQASDLSIAKRIVDYIWDNIFQYSNEYSAETKASEG